MLTHAIRLIRKMGGGAQAHLLECDDGHHYVVKFRNSRERRTLVNEWIGATLLKYLQISTPPVAIVNLTPEFLGANPDVNLRLPSRCAEIAPGPHFGSRYPQDSAHVGIYDLVPDVLLNKVVNLDEFLAVLAFDKWVGNADSRQAVFIRSRFQQCSPLSPDSPNRFSLFAYMIDHGYVFGGPHWSFYDSPLQGLYFRSTVYRSVRSLDDFQPWLDRIANCPEKVIDDARKQIPAEWLDGDESALEALLTKLFSRRKRVAKLLADCRYGRGNPFRSWEQREAHAAGLCNLQGDIPLDTLRASPAR